MKKMVFIMGGMFLVFCFWLIEPLNNNPLYFPSTLSVKSSTSLQCPLEGRNFQGERDGVMEKYISSNDFLGVSAGVSAYFQILLDRGGVATSLSNSYGTKSSAHALVIDLSILTADDFKDIPS